MTLVEVHKEGRVTYYVNINILKKVINQLKKQEMSKDEILEKTGWKDIYYKSSKLKTIIDDVMAH